MSGQAALKRDPELEDATDDDLGTMQTISKARAEAHQIYSVAVNVRRPIMLRIITIITYIRTTTIIITMKEQRIPQDHTTRHASLRTRYPMLTSLQAKRTTTIITMHTLDITIITRHVQYRPLGSRLSV